MGALPGGGRVECPSTWSLLLQRQQIRQQNKRVTATATTATRSHKRCDVTEQRNRDQAESIGGRFGQDKAGSCCSRRRSIERIVATHNEADGLPRVPLGIGNLQGCGAAGDWQPPSCRWILLRPTTMATTSIDESNAMVDRDVGSLQQATSNLFENIVVDGKASLDESKNKTQAQRSRKSKIVQRYALN